MNTYFRFEQPWFLLLLALLPLFWFIGSRFQRPPVIRFAAARIFERATTFRRSWTKALQNALYYFGCACLIVALARPQFGRRTNRIRASGIDIMLLLDVSLSMLSEDFSIGSQRASRLEVVKQVTEKFISGPTGRPHRHYCFLRSRLPGQSAHARSHLVNRKSRSLEYSPSRRPDCNRLQPCRRWHRHRVCSGYGSKSTS